MLLCCIPNLVLHYKLNEMPHHSHNLGLLIPQSKSLSQPRPEFSTHQILIYPPHTTARVLAPKTPNNMPYPKPGILLPKTPKIPSPLKPSAPTSPTFPRFITFQSRTPTPNKHKIPLPSRPAKLRPPPPEALHTPKHSLKSHKSQQYHDHFCPWRIPHYSLSPHPALSAAPWKALASAWPVARAPKHHLCLWTRGQATRE